jgi:hypothetical protein
MIHFECSHCGYLIPFKEMLYLKPFLHWCPCCAHEEFTMKKT